MIDLQQKYFSNGLRVVVAPNHKAPVCNITVCYKVGSKDESATHTGLAHLFEHLMFDNFQSPENKKFDMYLTEAGGECNAYTTYDHTLYHISLPSSHIELGAWLEAQRMSRFIIPQSALDTQISVVSEEILQVVKNRPYGNWRGLQAAEAYTSDCMYHWEVIGSEMHVQATKYSDAEKWYNRFYRPDNAVVVLSGDISVQEGFALTQRYFEDIPASTVRSDRSVFSEQQRRVGSVTESQSVPFDAIFESYHFDGFLDDRTMVADVLSSIMSDGQSSRLYRSMQYDNHTASEAGCYADKREYDSLLTFYAFAATPDIEADTLRENIHVQIERLCRDGVTDSELTKARNKIQTGIAYELQTCSGIAEAVAQQSMFWNDPERVNTLIARYNAITKDQVVEFARETCRQENRVNVNILAEN